MKVDIGRLKAVAASREVLIAAVRLLVLLLNLLFGLRISEAATVNLVHTIVDYIAGRGAPEEALQAA